MRVLVQHRSRYVYPRPSLLGPQLIRLRPADHTHARVETYRLDVDLAGRAEPAPLHPGSEHRVHWQRDPHGNHIARLTFKAGQPVAELAITVELAVELGPVNPFDFFVDDRAKQSPFVYPDALATELASFLDTGDPAYRLGRLTTELLKELPARGDTVDLLVETCRRVHERIAYVIRDEPGIWTPEDTLGHGRGSCRDSAVLLVALLRARGIAARFASGYLIQLADEGMIPDEPKGVTRDVVDLHAWAEAFVPGAGWIGLDATSGLFTGEGHIPLACTASPSHAAPLAGTSEHPASSVEFAATITRLGHEARPTAPFTDEIWTELLGAGDRADAQLVAAKLEVMVGGEPTFTAREPEVERGGLRPTSGIDHEASWEAGALGPDKWQRGRMLALRLRDRLAPGGVVLHRMGKHYPGEPLPRWALDVIARRDGALLWPQRTARVAVTADGARKLGEALATALGIAPELHPAYDDPWEIMRAEAQLPPEIDPRAAGLDDPEERRRLARQLDRGVGSIVGWVLPLAHGATDAWVTDRWTFRRGHLFLLPGDSPIGLRLPLGSLVAGAPPPLWAEAPNFVDPRVDTPHDEPALRGVEVPPPVPEPGLGVRTALAIEPRDGELWVFLPPLPSFENFCALVHAIDRARAETGLDCHLEGYAPPPSPQLARFAITPDPGVLEVNLPPVATSREAAALHATVFETALACGLTSERYLLDGRAAGSGGGNHITIGGPSAATSPWLARPDLIASLVTFAQHHPSLSYMFSGLFVGPTSQAPRVDEARHDTLAELELALPRLFATDVPAPPWQVDALLRHLLVDVSGSTHRAEISIDKLYDPHTPFGRQGIVELRAFEMPPHPRMTAAQVVLVRALVAAFAAAPYEHALVRWGTELHDRFLLPYYLWRDFTDVLAHLERSGVELPIDAYRPFVELRCPLVGALEVDGGRVEVRNAIEPWHVLGEEATPGGTSRYVDSSMERLELRSIGLDLERFRVVAGGVVVPMRAAPGRETQIGGVRFRAWCPPHALHPHLGIHHPLRIEVIDTWSKAMRGVAAAAYHVWHPEGRAYDASPLTRVEAAARRSQRFTLEGPSPSPVHARHTEPSHDRRDLRPAISTAEGRCGSIDRRDLRPAISTAEGRCGSIDRRDLRPAISTAEGRCGSIDQPYTLDLRRFDPGTSMPRAEDWIE